MKKRDDRTAPAVGPTLYKQQTYCMHLNDLMELIRWSGV
jgi:hypothetical protein